MSRAGHLWKGLQEGRRAGMPSPFSVRLLWESVKALSPQPGSAWQSPCAGSSWRAFQGLLSARGSEPYGLGRLTSAPHWMMGTPTETRCEGPWHIPMPWSQPGSTAETAGKVPSCTFQRVMGNKALATLTCPRPYTGRCLPVHAELF